VYAYVDKLLTLDAEYYFERRVIFPTIANTFGTCDLLVRVGNAIHVLDFKFGEGVRVLALYPDGDEDVINAQLLFYAAAARHSHRAFFANSETIVLTILQPASIELDAELESSVTVTPAELDEFVAAYRAACAQALSPTPQLQRGEWCRFCPARPICPAHTAPLLSAAPANRPTANGWSSCSASKVQAARLSGRMAALSRLRAPRRRGNARCLSQDTPAAARGVTQAKRLATWMRDQLADAAMREVLTLGVPANDDSSDDDDAESPELSLTRDRVARVLAMLEAKHANGGLNADELKAHEAATLRLYGAGAAPKKFARLDAQQVDGVIRDQYRFAGAGQTGRMSSKATQIHNPRATFSAVVTEPRKRHSSI
jgi:hypothetical protein